DQGFSCFGRIAHLQQECDADASHAILSFQTYLKAKAVDRGHGCFLRLDVRKCPGKQDERILVVGVHVLNDFDHRVSEWVRLRAIILRSRYPAHHSEAGDVINVHDVYSVKREIFKIPSICYWCNVPSRACGPRPAPALVSTEHFPSTSPWRSLADRQ